MPTQGASGKPTTRRYSDEEKAQAVRLVRQLRAELGTDHGTMQVPAPTDVRPTLDSVGVHTNQVSSRRRASTGLFASTPPGKQARKTSKEGIASHTASATKALKEKW